MNTMNSHRRLLSALVLTLVCVIGQGAEARLLRFPAIHGNQIVFGYAGDLFLTLQGSGHLFQFTDNYFHAFFEMLSNRNGVAAGSNIAYPLVIDRLKEDRCCSCAIAGFFMLLP